MITYTLLFHHFIIFNMSQPKYYLFSSKSCPYAHRCEIAIRLLNLSNVKVLFCDPLFTFKDGWKIMDSDNPTNFTSLKELYDASGIVSKFVSLPVLYDNELEKIVSNDSIDLIKFLIADSGNAELNPQNNYDSFYNEFNEKISVGTYKAGHAKTQEEYSKYFDLVFEYLDKLNEYLKDKYYVIENKLSFVDIIVYCHLIRFDLVFYNLFSLNKKHLWEYDNIYKYLHNLSSFEGFKMATDLDEIKRGAYLTENNLPQNLGYTKVPLGYCGVQHYF